MFFVYVCALVMLKNDYIIQITKAYTYAFFYCFSSYIEVYNPFPLNSIYFFKVRGSTASIPCEYLVVLAPFVEDNSLHIELFGHPCSLT